jgi:hypothetical protein
MNLKVLSSVEKDMGVLGRMGKESFMMCIGSKICSLFISYPCLTKSWVHGSRMKSGPYLWLFEDYPRLIQEP